MPAQNLISELDCNDRNVYGMADCDIVRRYQQDLEVVPYELTFEADSFNDLGK
jgi:hypothetical protein